MAFDSLVRIILSIGGVIVILFSPFSDEVRLLGGLMLICTASIVGAIQHAAELIKQK